MTNEEILKKAIEKAVKGGYVFKVGENETKVYKIPDYGTIIVWGGLPSIIFSHSFAKAFWGERIGCVVPPKLYIDVDDWEKSYSIPIWQHHLQQMVLAEEPLKYLEKFL